MPAGPRRTTRVVGAALALVTLAAVGCTAVVVHGADRSPGAPAWRLPQAAKEKKAPEKQSGLRALLLPFGEERYVRGPEVAKFGSDTELTGRQTSDLLRQSLRSLPRSQRLQLERQYEKNPVKGMAVRSYTSTAWAGEDSHAFTVEMVLSRSDRSTLRARNRSQQQFIDTMKIFRKGPAIEGHEDHAACFLPPAVEGDKLDSMSCSGYVGDIGVTAWIEGTAPLDLKGAADMMRAQFDRIKEPGEAV
ncbi:hypothetical protein GT028_20465 [Streptomyces sp. SID2999]|uniref:hypothetical protein n=1 Tax=Streptomyces sp. SID2999 TaxID=2690258 RepID=UPI00136DAE4B|nr:hypothetical protein [Streptomyces sp. SID2999]MYZ09730.1 hypothetical protein [Streptomyces sp. SID2999]